MHGDPESLGPKVTLPTSMLIPSEAFLVAARCRSAGVDGMLGIPRSRRVVRSLLRRTCTGDRIARSVAGLGSGGVGLSAWFLLYRFALWAHQHQPTGGRWPALPPALVY